jgi:hypothetical protein
VSQRDDQRMRRRGGFGHVGVDLLGGVHAPMGEC